MSVTIKGRKEDKIREREKGREGGRFEQISPQLDQLGPRYSILVIVICQEYGVTVKALLQFTLQQKSPL